jgi:hypothetical protein
LNVLVAAMHPRKMLIIVQEKARGAFELKDISQDATWYQVFSLIQQETGYTDFKVVCSHGVFSPRNDETMRSAMRAFPVKDILVLTIVGHETTDIAYAKARVAARAETVAELKRRASELETVMTAAMRLRDDFGGIVLRLALQTPRSDTELGTAIANYREQHAAYTTLRQDQISVDIELKLLAETAAQLDKELRDVTDKVTERHTKAVKALMGVRSVGDLMDTGSRCCDAPGCRTCDDGGASAR